MAERGRYRHFKGEIYWVLGMATHSESGQQLVVYENEKTRKMWVRPASMWDDHIEREAYSGPRFVRITVEDEP